MKIAVASDLHLEFGDINVQNDSNADVLILSGDILVAADIGRPDPDNFMEGARSNRYVDFFRRCSFQFPHTIYVLGNHEHYHGDFATTANRIRSMLESNMLSNVYLLDLEVRIIDDVTFIGGTLWTDMNNGDQLTLYHMTKMMNDFRCVQNSHKVVHYKAYEQINGVDNREKPVFKTRTAKFSPEDAFEEHAKMKGYIQQIVEGKPDQKFVVVGHHSPSFRSVHPMYANDTIMNGGYSSNMEEFIEDHPQIKLWTHGHTHHNFDYMIGQTRVVCNPRGYINYEAQADSWQLQTVEI
jgi:Icc-related predicted phosphoesterase